MDRNDVHSPQARPPAKLRFSLSQEQLDWLDAESQSRNVDKSTLLSEIFERGSVSQPGIEVEEVGAVPVSAPVVSAPVAPGQPAPVAPVAAAPPPVVPVGAAPVAAVPAQVAPVAGASVPAAPVPAAPVLPVEAAPAAAPVVSAPAPARETAPPPPPPAAPVEEARVSEVPSEEAAESARGAADLAAWAPGLSGQRGVPPAGGLPSGAIVLVPGPDGYFAPTRVSPDLFSTATGCMSGSRSSAPRG